MSRPRAATSVATRTFTFPALKSSSAASRCSWPLLLWIAAVLMPARDRWDASLSAPCLVRTKMSACRTSPERTSRTTAELFASRSTRWTTWRTSSVAVLLGVAWTDAGSRSSFAERRLMESEKVAEKSRFWRWAGSQDRIWRMSSMNPMSSIRSASSRTQTSTAP